MKHLLILLLLVISIISCETGDCSSRLALVDTLLYRDMDDSAQIELDKITAKDLQETDDHAYYRLLKTQMIFRKGLVIQNDSMIDQSIAYYETSNDKQKLAQAYYFKGRMLCKRGEIKDGMYFLKKAEYQAKDVNDDLLKTKIYMNIGYCIGNADDFAMSANYFKKALEYARFAHNNEFILLNLENLSTIYSFLGRMDSAMICINEYIPLIQLSSQSNQAHTFANIAALYEYIDTKKSKEYANRSIDLMPTSTAFHVLASIYTEECNYTDADSCFRTALELSDELGQQISILQGLFDLKQKNNNNRDLAILSKRIIALRDSFAMKEKRDSIKEVQQLYELSAMKEKTSRSLGLATVLISVLVVCLLGGGTVYVFQRRRARSGLEKERLTINKLTEEQAKLLRKVEKLSSDKDDKKKQIAELKRKIKAVEERQKTMVAEMESRMKDVMARGKELYDEICSDGTIAKWSSDDATCFTEYYVSTHKEFASCLSDGYTKLTDNRKIFLILLDMKKDSDAICRIMNVKQSTLRTFRLRTKGILIKE